ncbi:BTB/POZ domain-containing protein 1 isoform X1 [Solea senegalensis]|nr:BTB/POZ domain-containing protein 1 isoform X1 [Solea senegalensis]
MATGSGGGGLVSNHGRQEAASNSVQSGAAVAAAAAMCNAPGSGSAAPPGSPPVLGLHREPVYNWQATKSSLKERFAFLFNNELLSDVRFIVGKGRQAQRIPAHKFVLAAGSAVFDAMFNGGMATTSAEIELPDVEPAAFLALLRFLYSDEIHIGPETVMTTLYTAKKYAVPALEGHCVEFLTKHLRADNALMLLTQARLFDEPQLASLCLDIIDKSTADAINAEGFTDIDLDTLCAVLERDTLSIRENRLFGAVVRWAEAECYRQQLPPTSENKQKVLGKALPLIRFPLMTVEEFAAGKQITKNNTAKILMNPTVCMCVCVCVCVCAEYCNATLTSYTFIMFLLCPNKSNHRNQFDILSCATGPAQSGILFDREVVNLFLHFTVNPKPRVDYIDRPRCCLRGEECSINRFQQVESRWGYSGTSDRIR